jgi:signal transduction histidine kinase
VAALRSSRWLVGPLVGALLIAAVTGVVALAAPHLPVLNLLVLYLLPVLPVAVRWGAGPAAAIAVLGTVVFAVLFLPPHPDWLVADSGHAVALGVFVVTAVMVANLAARLRRSARQADRLSREQAALRRVAELVAQASPAAVFEAVTREVGELCGADLARLECYADDGTVTGVAAWSRVPARLAVGTRFPLDGVSIARLVRESGGPVRVATFTGATGAIADEARALGIRSSVGCPVVVNGRLWGVVAASSEKDAFPAGTEEQIGHFTELVATAIANAEARTEVAASRARVIAAADATRRRLERDLHDGAQQRLVSLALELRHIEEEIPPELTAVRSDIGRAAQELTDALDELRELSRGIHPAILSEGGLGPALRTLARRAGVPVELDIRTGARFPEPVEVAAYYVVSEAITNTSKHAGASYAEVVVEADGELLRLSVRDDGAGGADPARGSGLTGLRDRVEALGGSLRMTSPAGEGTRLEVALPTTG